MSVVKLEDRPPFVEFYENPIEDRAASIAAGHYVGRDVTYVKVTPMGGNLVHEDVAEDWLKRKESVRDPFAHHFKELFRAYKDGIKLPENGIPIKTWPVLSPAQVKLCISLHILTVEDLAALGEEGLRRLGIGAQAMKQKAIEYINAANGTGKITEEIAALKATVDRLVQESENKDKIIASFKAQAPEKSGRATLKAAAS